MLKLFAVMPTAVAPLIPKIPIFPEVFPSLPIIFTGNVYPVPT